MNILFEFNSQMTYNCLNIKAMKYILFIFTVVFLPFVISAQQKNKTKSKRAPIDTTRFAFVEGGTYKMGTDKPLEPQEGPAHDVTVNSFWIAKTEITFAGLRFVFAMTPKRDTMGSMGWGRGKQPAIWVSWNDAIAYCNWMSGKEKLSKCYLIDSTGIVKYLDTAKGYRLLTEAEWEFAARGGNKSKGFGYAGSNDINDVCWFKDNAGGKANKVAQKKPNELGPV